MYMTDGHTISDTIIEFPNLILLQKAEPVFEITNEILDIFDRMEKIMLEKKWSGIAAPLIGESLRMIILKRCDLVYKLVNPAITWRQGTSKRTEKCLCFPGQQCEITRSSEVIVEAKNSNGKEESILVGGQTARMLEHQIDHLNGRLICNQKQ